MMIQLAIPRPDRNCFAKSCGCHFNEACQTEENEALRNDEACSHAAVWEYKGPGQTPVMHKEPLVFENVKPAQRSYK